MDITIALGGGGSKGHAHIGVLRVLVREGFRIRAVAGTSAGAIIGSMFAAGLSPDEIEAANLDVDQNRVFERSAEDGPSLMGLKGVADLLQRTVGERTFEELELPFIATAVDVHTGQEVWLRSGRVVDAVLASSAVPGMFPPRSWDGHLLVDGGVLDPVPVCAARSLAPDLPVVAVVLSPPPDRLGPTHAPRLLASVPFMGRIAGRLRLAQAFDIFLRSVDVAGAWFTEMRLMLDQPDVIVRPAVGHIGLTDRVDVSAVAMLGEQAAEASLPALREAVSWRGRLRRLRRRAARKVQSPWKRYA